jgi:hypothetical protein
METTHAPDRPLVPPARAGLARLPWWAIALLAAGVFFIYLIMTNANYRDTFFYLQAGVATTLRITLIAFPLATIIGLITGLARTSKNVVVRWGGLEPPRLSAHGPQPCLSANSSTSARAVVL